MAKDLGKGYKYKKMIIKYPNGDIYDGMCAAYYSSNYEPHGEGIYYNRNNDVSFKADWEYRSGPYFETIEIIDKPRDIPYVIVQAYATEIYSDLVYLGIIKVETKTFHFKELECIVLEPHSWLNHIFTIKRFDENELEFDFAGPKVDKEKFIGCVINKGVSISLNSAKSSHIIWDHDDEYDVTQYSSIKALYF